MIGTSTRILWQSSLHLWPEVLGGKDKERYLGREMVIEGPTFLVLLGFLEAPIDQVLGGAKATKVTGALSQTQLLIGCMWDPGVLHNKRTLPGETSPATTVVARDTRHMCAQARTCIPGKLVGLCVLMMIQVVSNLQMAITRLDPVFRGLVHQMRLVPFPELSKKSMLLD